MEWSKIPTNLINGKFDDSEILAIVKYQLLYALYEEQPNEKILSRFLTKKQKNIVKNFIADIQPNVENEINSIQKKRQTDKLYYAKNKEKCKNSDNLSENLSENFKPEQIREDKIREEIYTESTNYEEQANDKLSSINFRNSKDFKYIQDVYNQVYGLRLARLKSEQLLVVKSWFDIVDNPTKIQLVLEYYKNEYKWDGDKKPSANWIFNSSTNFINVYDDMVNKNAHVFDVLERA